VSLPGTEPQVSDLASLGLIALMPLLSVPFRLLQSMDYLR